MDRIAAEWATGVQAVSWHGDAGNVLSLNARFGTRHIRVADVLGVDAQSAVAISPAGRIHLYAGGSYTYSDNNGLNWAPPSAAPLGSAPHLVVEPSGYARLFFISGGMLLTTVQQPDGSWSSPESLLPVVDYDAVRVREGVVAALALGSNVAIYRFPDGLVTTLNMEATSARLTFRRDQVLLGIGYGPSAHLGRASIARSMDDGRTWSFPCPIQNSINRIGDVAAFPSAQGPYIALWSWWQPCGGGIVPGCAGAFPYIVISTVRWPEGGICVPEPAVDQADNMSWEGGGMSGPPALFFTHSPQTSFRLVVGENPEAGLIAFNGIQLDTRLDVYWASFSPDGILSGTKQ